MHEQIKYSILQRYCKQTRLNFEGIHTYDTFSYMVIVQIEQFYVVLKAFRIVLGYNVIQNGH